MNADHSHCFYDCEHPQPFECLGVLWCGKCYFDSQGLMWSAMRACTPQTCPTDAGWTRPAERPI